MTSAGARFRNGRKPGIGTLGMECCGDKYNECSRAERTEFAWNSGRRAITSRFRVRQQGDPVRARPWSILPSVAVGQNALGPAVYFNMVIARVATFAPAVTR